MSCCPPCHPICFPSSSLPLPVFASETGPFFFPSAIKQFAPSRAVCVALMALHARAAWPPRARAPSPRGSAGERRRKCSLRAPIYSLKQPDVLHTHVTSERALRAAIAVAGALVEAALHGAATGRGPRNTRGQQQTAAAAHLESLVKTSGGNLQRVTARTLSDAGQNVCGDAGLHGGDGGLPANNVEAALPFLTACDGAQRGRYRSEAGSKTDTARSSGTRKRAVHLDQMRNLLRVAHAVGRLQTTRMRG